MITKEVFEKKVKDVLRDKTEGILVAQIPQSYLHLSNEENVEIRKLYGTGTWWKLLGKIDGIEIIGNEDSKKAILRTLVNTNNNTNTQPVKTTSLAQTQKTEKTEKPVPVVTKKTTINLSEKIKTLLIYLNQNLYGKEEAVRLALLSAVANESIFFMGPPGTAKSMISRRIAAAFKDFYEGEKFTAENGSYFEYLMNEFSTPDEICGPVELSALNETPSRFVRQIEGYLPGAKVAFLDEIWKSGPAILNTLLTIINEKKFHNGKIVEKVPLVSLAAASNELPREDQNLDALWDRFILRVFVNPVQNEEDFFKLIDDGNTEITPNQEQLASLLQISEVEKWQEEIQKVEFGDKAKAVITAIRKELTLLNQDEKHKGREAYYVSDRRWKKIVRILKTSAFLNGRKAVDLMDCSLIEYAIWNTDKQHDEVSGIVEKILKQNGISEDGNSLTDITDAVDHFKDIVKEKWFDKVVTKSKKAEPVKYKMQDGNMAYKIVDAPKNIDSYNNCDIWFISEDYYDSNRNRSGAYYDDTADIVGDYDYYIRSNSFEIKDDTASWVDGYTGSSYHCKLEMSKPVAGKTSYEPKLFEPAAKNTVYEVFEKEHYLPLLNKINETITALQNSRKNSAEPFENNLFTEKKYAGIILEKIDDSIIELKKKKDELEEVHNSYSSDSNVKSNFTLGEILLSDGTTKSAKSKVSEENIVGKVCMFGEDDKIAYALAVKTFSEKTWEQAMEIANNYGKEEKLPAPYDSDWSLPTVKQWEQISKNLKDAGINPEGGCWSSDSKNDTDAYLYDFEKNEADFNSKAHPFNVYLIRKLAL